MHVHVQVETRFGTKVMVCQSVMRSAEALRKLVMDERYTKAASSNRTAEVCIDLAQCLCQKYGHHSLAGRLIVDTALLQTIHDLVTDMSFIADMEAALRLLQPILALLTSLEADSPLLSQCLPLWLSVFQHVKQWAADEHQQTPTLEAVLLKRFGKCYHQAMSAAFLCDAAFYTFDAESEAYTANE